VKYFLINTGMFNGFYLITKEQYTLYMYQESVVWSFKETKCKPKVAKQTKVINLYSILFYCSYKLFNLTVTGNQWHSVNGYSTHCYWVSSVNHISFDAHCICATTSYSRVFCSNILLFYIFQYHLCPILQSCYFD
jgi:hypothetical protein